MDANGDMHLNMKHYQAVRHPLQLVKVREEIEMGEFQMNSTLHYEIDKPERDAGNVEGREKGSRRKPFTRNPRRYPVQRP